MAWSWGDFEKKAVSYYHPSFLEMDDQWADDTTFLLRSIGGLVEANVKRDEFVNRITIEYDKDCRQIVNNILFALKGYGFSL